MGPDAASWCARECIAGVDVAGCGTPIEHLVNSIFFIIVPFLFKLKYYFNTKRGGP